MTARLHECAGFRGRRPHVVVGVVWIGAFLEAATGDRARGAAAPAADTRVSLGGGRVARTAMRRRQGSDRPRWSCNVPTMGAGRLD